MIGASVVLCASILLDGNFWKFTCKFILSHTHTVPDTTINHPALKTLNCRGAQMLSLSRVQNIKHAIPMHLLAIITKCLLSSNTRLI